jgi:hypothetical protein
MPRRRKQQRGRKSKASESRGAHEPPRAIEDQFQTAMIELDPKRMGFANTEESANGVCGRGQPVFRPPPRRSHRIAMGLLG